jgi:hypothetical protein
MDALITQLANDPARVHDLYVALNMAMAESAYYLDELLRRAGVD